MFFKFKKNLDKDDFESILFSNKFQKSHVWPKNIKKEEEVFFNKLAHFTYPRN